MSDTTSPAGPRVRLPMPQPDGPPLYRHNLTRKERSDLVEIRVLVVNTLPIVFVPGVMGSNLRAMDSEMTKVWNLDSPAGLLADKVMESAGDRQKLLHPDRTLVDDRGQVPSEQVGSIIVGKDKTPEASYRQRGWGEIGKGSYQDFLMMLEKTLNGHRTGQPDQNDVAAKIAELMELKAKDPADQHWRPQKGEAHIETRDFEKLREWFFPVYACGYNWLDDNAKSAQRLKQRIEQVIAERNNANSRCQQVILVTHSMGGLVARACQQLDGMESKIAGIVHGVMPVDGAPIAYRRCKLGLAEENWAVGQVIGSTGQEVTAIFAQAPGPLELLPTHRYSRNWIEVRADEKTVQKTLHESDPYTEIYRRRDRWWALVKEEWLAPKDGVPIKWVDYLKFLTLAEDFHKQVVTEKSYHPNTYAFYGADTKGKTRSFERVVWRMKRGAGLSDTGPTPDDVYVMTPQQVDMDGENPEYVKSRQQIKVAGKGTAQHAVEAVQWELRADMADGTGDGTVPAQSGRSPVNCAKVREVFRLSGVEHEPAYRNESPIARQVALYAISKIALEARLPPGPPLKPKGQA
ncbi:triacylglycerol lipase [Variovorax sp. OV329]|uniref:esterase/lipase family protein n=1 Tax=Variovorax sp. OV329 TaxID=1882825 RepID=UPI0008EAF6B1|nr:hypothetical protein [Variovorax sp. OV329]SFM82016.1 PGAP1-like protein [Variovorax sp. OV329]